MTGFLLPDTEVIIEYIKGFVKSGVEFHHYQDFHEVFLLLEGKGRLFYGEASYALGRGALFVARPCGIHYTVSTESDYSESCLLRFKMENLSAILNDAEIKELDGKLESCLTHLTEEQTENLLKLFGQCKSTKENKGMFHRKMTYASIVSFLVYVISCAKGTQAAEGRSIRLAISNTLSFIKENYRRHITLDELSKMAWMSKFHFSRTFKETIGVTAMEYLTNYRLAKARSLLANTEMDIENIAAETGFASTQSLRYAFRKVCGMAPSKFRKSGCKKNSKI